MAMNILIVDDSSVVRSMIAKTLNLAGVPLGEVYHAANGLEGLDALKENWIDLIFADLNMPVMDGETMITKIRENPVWTDLPIIVVSTEGSETRIGKLQAMNTRFIHKPFTPEGIRKTVNELLRIDHEQPCTR